MSFIFKRSLQQIKPTTTTSLRTFSATARKMGVEIIPFKTTIGVGQVIKGWDEGVPQLSLGEKAKLICTPDYAYGARGFPPVIPANSTLIFEVELLAIN